MTTQVRDLQGQRTLIIDARSTTVFLDIEDRCIEFDRGILLNALKSELSTKALACLGCAVVYSRAA